MPSERSSSSLLSLQSHHTGRSSRASNSTANYSQAEQDALKEIRREKAALLLEIRNLKDEIADCSWIIERLDVDEDGKPNSERQYMATGRKKFNLDSKKGIEYLVEQKVLQRTPEDVARFLFGGEGLMKTAIGVYLGEPDAFNQSVGISRLIDWLIDWLIEWVIDGLIEWMMDWLIGWVIFFRFLGFGGIYPLAWFLQH